MSGNQNTNQLPYQVNVFVKGMDTDTSDALISNESYRLAKNLRYITDTDENTGELRLIEGVSKIDLQNDDETINDSVIRAFCSIRDIGVLICEKQNKEWAVFRIETNQTGYIAYKIFGWCEDYLSQNTKISAILKYEDSDQLQLYIADGDHPLMKINVYDTSGSSDIRYVSNGLSFSDLNKVQIDSILTGGQLEAGLVQYSYRLYNNNNVATQIAPLSNVKAITNTYSEIGPLGLTEQEQSSIGLRIKIEISVPAIYSKIQVYRIQYLVNGQLPKIQLICDEKLTLDSDNYYTYDDLGDVTLQELTAEEFNVLTGIYIQPAVIESKNNILFAGNIKYEIDVLDETYLNMDFRAFSAGDGVTVNDWPSPSENLINTNLTFEQQYSEAAWKTIKPGFEDTIGGYGPKIEWKFKVNNGPYTINTLPASRHPGIEKLQLKNDKDDKYSKPVTLGLRHDEIYRYGIILYSKHGIKYPVKWIADIRTPNISGAFGASDEVNKRFVSLSRITNGATTQYEEPYTLYPVFKLHENVLNSDVISGYEIVRVHRTVDDMATITQGIISATVQKNDDRKEVSSSGMPFLDHVIYTDDITRYPQPSSYEGKTTLNNYTTETDINVLQFYSPEVAYQPDDIMQILNTENNLYLQCLYPLSTIHRESGATPRYPEDFDFQVELDNIMMDNTESDPTKSRITYLTQNMYYFDPMSYKLFYGLYTRRNGNYDIRKRIKWYHSAFVADHLLSAPSTGQSTSEIYKNLYGLNVYKLHRSNNKMPNYITKWDLEEDESPSTVPTQLTYDIQDCALIKPMDYNKLVDSTSFNGKEQQSVVGDYTFFNFVAPFIAADTTGDFNINKLKSDADANKFRDELIATCDPSLALTFGDSFKQNVQNVIQHFYRDEYRVTSLNTSRGDTLEDCEYSMLCNIRRNVIPYGGFSKYSRDHSTYVQHGYYFNADYTDNIEMLDGDTLVTTFEFVPAHKWYDATHTSAKDTIVCQVAVESSIDIDLDAGDKFSNNISSNPTLVQANPCNFNDVYIQKKPAYVYNTAYSIDPQLLLVNSSLETIENSIKNFDYRVHYSNPASDNQAVDPWLVFQPLNYLDVDSKYGAITNMRTFKNQLVFWQQTATGVLSVNERVQIAVESNLPLALGTGGVLERFDYLTTTNGMKQNQHADTQSDYTLYWWDYDNNTICAYSRGSAPVQLSKTKHVQNILNRAAKNKQLIDCDIQQNIYPVLTYDRKYNEALFKLGIVDKEESSTLVYSEQQACFTGIYNINPTCYFNFASDLVFLNKDDNEYNMYRWNVLKVDNHGNKHSYGFDNTPLLPYIKYMINNQSNAVKVYDNVEFAGTIPNSDSWDEKSKTPSTGTLTEDIKFEFNTPLKQVGKIDGTQITNRQLDFKFAVPRRGEYKTINDEQVWVTTEYGDRMRGKTMQCAMSSDSNSLNFSLQYIITKYRISWS